MEWCHITSPRQERNSGVCCHQEKLWLQSLTKREMLFLWTLKVSGNTEKFHCLSSLSLSYKKNDWSVAPMWQQQATHKCAHHRGLHKIWVDSVATPVLKPWSCCIGFLPLWSSESLSARTPSPIAWGTSKCHSVIAADNGDNSYWAGIHAVVQRWKSSVLTRMDATMKRYWAVLYWSLVKFLHMYPVNSVKQKIGSTSLWLPLCIIYCTVCCILNHAQTSCYNLSNRTAGRVQIMKFY